MVNEVNAQETAPKVSVAGIRKKVTSNVNKAAISIIIQQVVIVFAAVLVSIAAVVVLMLMGKKTASLMSDPGLMLAITGIAGIIGDIAAAFFIAKTVKLKGLKKAFRAPKGGILDLILPAFAVAGVSQIVANLIMLIPLFQSNGDSLSQTLNINFNNPVSAIMGILYIALLGPVLEEILCRGMILRVGSSISNKFGIILSALLFSFMHMNFLQGINTFVMGLILGYITIKSGSIIPAIIAHIFNNSLAVAEMCIGSLAGEAVLETVSAYLPFVLGAIGIVALIIMLVRNKKLDEENDLSLESNIRVSDEMISETGVSRSVIAKHALSRSWGFYTVLGLFAICGTAMLFLQSLSKILLNR